MDMEDLITLIRARTDYVLAALNLMGGGENPLVSDHDIEEMMAAQDYLSKKLQEELDRRINGVTDVDVSTETAPPEDPVPSDTSTTQVTTVDTTDQSKSAESPAPVRRRAAALSKN